MMRALMRSAALLATVVLLAGCDLVPDVVEDSVRDARPGSFASEARGLPGVADATVEKTALDTDYWSYDAVVDMEDDATAAEIAGALDKLAGWAGQQHEEEHTTTLTVGAGEARAADGCWTEGPPTIAPAAASAEANLRRAQLLHAATGALEEAVCVGLHTWKVFADDAVALGERVLAVPELAAAPGLVVETPHGWMGPDGPLTRGFLDAYAAAQAATGRVPGGSVRINNFAPEQSESDGSPPASGVDVGVYVRLDGHRAAKALATPATEDPRWPAVRAQLDVLRRLPEGSTLSVTLQHDKGCTTCFWDWTTELVHVRKGREVELGKRPLWQDAAEAYLAAAGR